MVGPAHVPLAALIVPFGLALLALAPLALPLLALHLICTTSALMAKANHCAEGWKFYSGKCYYFSTYKKTWTASRDACVAEGADLVIITSTEEIEPCNSFGSPDCINVSLQVWVWSDESNYTYNDWENYKDLVSVLTNETQEWVETVTKNVWDGSVSHPHPGLLVLGDWRVYLVPELGP
uniref:C-type lectin domain-containing protein n=1 Tax=Electrophorus electricus TaxID=8005 RepID=A0AAY5ECS1_ELEEL